MEPEPNLVILAGRIDALFVETPGLLLTARQVRRLLDVPPAPCDAALRYLVEVGHLVREEDGQYRPRNRPMPFGISQAGRRSSQGGRVAAATTRKS